MPSEPGATDLANLIAGLAGEVSAARERAAAELFRQGRELARSATAAWIADPDLASALVLDASGFPEVTAGIAVSPASFERIRAANHAPRLADVPPDQDAKEFELHFPQKVRLDILTTKDPGGAGAIARYLQKFGEGIQQVELLARDVDRATEILRSRFGVQPIYPVTRPGADGTRVNFFLASIRQGLKVLVELVEPATRKP